MASPITAAMTGVSPERELTVDLDDQRFSVLPFLHIAFPAIPKSLYRA